GTRTAPKFGPRRQVLVDGYPETQLTLKETARRLGAGTGKWDKRMLDPVSPFGWRARAGFGDFNGDGLVDMVHADGRTRHPGGYADAYALFVQYRDGKGQLRLRRDRVITHPDGKPLKCPGYITSQAIPADWDQDGLLDLVCHWGPTNTKCQPMFVRNIGTRTEPRFDHPRPLALWGRPLYNLMKHGPYWAVHDIDGDGRPDLLAGCAYGNYAFYRRTAMDMPSRPTFRIGTARTLSR
ncbi:MAG: VCBS repeat-containing protein, partial [Planctomycetaceae bacterium]